MTIEHLGRISPADEVLRQLTSLIESERLKTGTRLPSERQLATDLGVSRVVVREASKKLEQLGLVSIRQGVGVLVTNNPSTPLQNALVRMLPLDKERLRQCAQARLLIEPELAALAALKATPSGIRKLEAAHDAMIVGNGIPEVAGQDIAFHETIAELAGNKILALMLKSTSELGRLSRELTLKQFGAERACAHHGKILAAIVDADPAAARKAMKSHLEAALGDLS